MTQLNQTEQNSDLDLYVFQQALGPGLVPEDPLPRPMITVSRAHTLSLDLAQVHLRYRWFDDFAREQSARVTEIIVDSFLVERDQLMLRLDKAPIIAVPWTTRLELYAETPMEKMLYSAWLAKDRVISRLNAPWCYVDEQVRMSAEALIEELQTRVSEQGLDESVVHAFKSCPVMSEDIGETQVRVRSPRGETVSIPRDVWDSLPLADPGLWWNWGE